MGNIHTPYAEIFHRLKCEMASDYLGIRTFSKRFPQGTLVDLGAGFGRILGAELRRPIILVENNPDMLDLLNGCEVNDPDVKVVAASGLRTGLADASAGAVTLTYASLAEMRPIAFALTEAFRILRPGGGLYIMMYNPDFPRITNSGLQRPVQGPSDFSASLLTMPMPFLGKYDYQTVIDVRTTQGAQAHLIRQTFPSADVLTHLLMELGFEDIHIVDEITGKEFIPNESRLFRLTATKKPNHLDSVLQPDLLEFYDRIAHSYSDVMTNGRYEGIIWLKEQMASWKGLHAKVLDLGCGNGVAGHALQDMGVNTQMFGIDFSDGMLAHTREHANYQGLLKWDLAKSLPVIEGCEFDLAIAIGVCEFIPELPALLTAIRHCLKVGGRGLLTFELLDQDGDNTDTIRVGSGIKKHRYTLSATKRLLIESGFSINKLSHGFAYLSPSLNTDVHYIFADVSRGNL